MDLSKVFDTINSELLVPKLHAYRFYKNSPKNLLSYLTNHLQSVNISATFSSWTELLRGVPQVSLLGYTAFNIHINDFFLTCNEL